MKVVLSWLREFAPTDLDADELAELLTAQGVQVERHRTSVGRPGGRGRGPGARGQRPPDSDKLCVARGRRTARASRVVVRRAEHGGRRPRALGPARGAGPGAARAAGAAEAPRRDLATDAVLAPRARHRRRPRGHPGAQRRRRRDRDRISRPRFGLDDAVLDIEVEPNRPDFLSVFGVAREVSAATGVPLIEPAPISSETEEEASSIATVAIEADRSAVPATSPASSAGVDAAGVPLRVQARLTASGMRPVSAVVDATNYVMLELGQPLHGFDMDRLAGPASWSAMPTDGERITTLDDVERELTPDDLLICDLEKPVAIGGVMGGATSEVSETTTDRSCWRARYFTRTGVLRTARRLDLHSEAVASVRTRHRPRGARARRGPSAGLIAAWAGRRRAPGRRRGRDRRPSGAGSRCDRRAPRCCSATRFRPPTPSRRLRRGSGLAHREQDDLVEVEVPGLPRGPRARGRPHRRGRPDRRGMTGSARRCSRRRQAGGVPEGYRFRQRIRDASGPGGAAGRPSAAVRLGRRSRAHRRHGCRSPWRTRSRPTTRSCARGCCPDCCARSRGTRLAARSPCALFETGIVFRLGDPVEERRAGGWALCGPASQGWSGDRRDFDVLDASGVLEAAHGRARDRGLVAGRGRRAARSIPGRSAAVLVGGERAGVVGEIHPADRRRAGARRPGCGRRVGGRGACSPRPSKEFVVRGRAPVPARSPRPGVRGGRGRRRRGGPARAARTPPATCWRAACSSTSSAGARCPRAPRASRSPSTSGRPTAP